MNNTKSNLKNKSKFCSTLSNHNIKRIQDYSIKSSINKSKIIDMAVDYFFDHLESEGKL